MRARFLADSGRELKVAAPPPPDAAVSQGLDKTRDKQPISDSERDVWLREAVWRAFLKIWHVPEGGLRPGISESEKQRFAMLVIGEFRQLASEGKLPIWGRKKDSLIWEPLPRDFWTSNQIDHIAIATAAHPDEVKACSANPLTKPDTSGNWSHFMTSKAAIEQLYPILQ
jgi:hypothetical protein